MVIDPDALRDMMDRFKVKYAKILDYLLRMENNHCMKCGSEEHTRLSDPRECWEVCECPKCGNQWWPH